MEKLIIDMGEVNLIAEKYDGDEFVVYFQDKKTDYITQDIVAVRQALAGGDLIPNTVECLVWSYGNDEDYTHRFLINQYLEAE